jgi:predicted XRE-type DNA-binding protein
MVKKRRKRAGSLISSHLGGIKRALLEGEKRPAFLEFLNGIAPSARGLYALYDKKGRLYYTGKASDLKQRLNQHLKDKHGDSWDRMTLFVVSDSANVAELEGLVIATAKPPGNKQKPKIGQDLRKSLRRHLREDATTQIDQAIYPERSKTTDRLLERITTKRLKAIGQSRLATVLGISQPRVSQLLSRGEMRSYIREAGKRDTILALLQKSGK